MIESQRDLDLDLSRNHRWLDGSGEVIKKTRVTNRVQRFGGWGGSLGCKPMEKNAVGDEQPLSSVVASGSAEGLTAENERFSNPDASKRGKLGLSGREGAFHKGRGFGA